MRLGSLRHPRRSTASGVRRWLAFAAYLWLASAAAAFSQQVGSPSADGARSAKPADRGGIIAGRVLDEGGQPFSSVIVTVLPAKGTYEQRRQVATDDAGNFRVTDLAPAAYLVECNAEGYLEDPDDDSHTYHLTGDSVTLRMRKGGVI